MRLSIIRFISSTLPFQRSRRTCLESALLLRKPAWKSPVAHPYADEDADCLSCQRSAQYAFLRCAWQGSTIWLPRSSFFKDTEFCKTCQHCVCTRNLRQALFMTFYSLVVNLLSRIYTKLFYGHGKQHTTPGPRLPYEALTGPMTATDKIIR